MSDRFTPGPWEISGSSFGGRVLVYEGTPGDAKGMVATCDAGNYSRSRAEGEANARLIAAAPDLLAALRPFAAFACDLGPDETCDCHNCVARAAIRKAVGE